MSIEFLDFSLAPAMLVALICALLVSAVVGFLALRTSGVAFMIVTLMFAQAGYLTILLMGKYTRGDEGFVIQQSDRVLFGFDLTQSTNRYVFAWVLFAICFIFTAWLVRTGFGRTLVAIRENEERARMLGYNVHRHKLYAVIISGVLSGAAGAGYALLFGYAGATFATVQYSIFPLLWVLLGGAGTTIGPLIGTLFMFYLIDIASEFTSAYMLIAGLVLILLTLFAPQGLAGVASQTYHALAAMNLLETYKLSKHYAGLQAVSDVDFELPEGQIRALIGPNGAGKTTFVGMLSGRIVASSGNILFAGSDVTNLVAHKRMALGIAYTFQITSIFARLTVHENVALAARRLHSADRAAVQHSVNYALSRVNLESFAGQIAGDMSYGHQRLLEIAMGLAQSPSLFILDEPTQGLTQSEVESFKQLIRSLAGETTILLIEHNMDVVMETADYITVLSAGKTLAEGTPQSVRADAAVQAAYLGRS